MRLNIKNFIRKYSEKNILLNVIQMKISEIRHHYVTGKNKFKSYNQNQREGTWGGKLSKQFLEYLI